MDWLLPIGYDLTIHWYYFLSPVINFQLYFKVVSWKNICIFIYFFSFLVLLVYCVERDFHLCHILFFFNILDCCVFSLCTSGCCWPPAFILLGAEVTGMHHYTWDSGRLCPPRAQGRCTMPCHTETTEVLGLTSACLACALVCWAILLTLHSFLLTKLNKQNKKKTFSFSGNTKVSLLRSCA